LKKIRHNFLNPKPRTEQLTDALTGKPARMVPLSSILLDGKPLEPLQRVIVDGQHALVYSAAQVQGEPVMICVVMRDGTGNPEHVNDLAGVWDLPDDQLATLLDVLGSENRAPAKAVKLEDITPIPNAST
jgi:hypothetical protein